MPGVIGLRNREKIVETGKSICGCVVTRLEYNNILALFLLLLVSKPPKIEGCHTITYAKAEKQRIIPYNKVKNDPNFTAPEPPNRLTYYRESWESDRHEYFAATLMHRGLKPAVQKEETEHRFSGAAALVFEYSQNDKPLEVSVDLTVHPNLSTKQKEFYDKENGCWIQK